MSASQEHEPTSNPIPINSRIVELVDAWRDTWHSPTSGPLFTENRTVPSWMPGDVKANAYPEFQARDFLITSMATSVVLAAARGEHEEKITEIYQSLRIALPGKMFDDLTPRLLKDTWAETIELMLNQ